MKEWWEFLDWSMMENSFFKLSKPLQDKILEKGYWGKGKGKFVKEKKKNEQRI